MAWACNPQGQLSLDRASYAPGATITVYGSFLPADAAIAVTGPAESKTVTSSSNGSFTTTFVAPAAAGTYVISATRPSGGQASAAFAVTAGPSGAPPALDKPPTSPAPASPRPLMLSKRQAIRTARAAVREEFSARARRLECRRLSIRQFRCRGRWVNVLRRYRGVLVVSRSGSPDAAVDRYRIKARSRGALVSPRSHRASGRIVAGS